MGFPVDRYTPHGYLHIPTHTRRLNPVGVVRSWEAGFRWHVPAYAGSYGGRRETYRAGVRLALDGRARLADLDEAASPYHTGSVMVHELRAGDARARVTWHLVGEHALCGSAQADRTPGIRMALHASYRRCLSASGEWGESGLVGRLDDGLVVLQGFEDGDALVLWASAPALDLGITASAEDAAAWVGTRAPGAPPSGFVTTLGERGAEVELHAIVGLPFASTTWVLARGRTLDDARRHLEEARREADATQRRLRTEDERFWRGAPQLTGDWPAHWRRGVVYDLETIRMMVRPPIGIYRHAWDGMQVQAPRVVLAETAMDSLVLAWADPALARSLLLGTLLDAPAPNVPCSREDGSYNMVAADGTVCGTSPAWGYPAWVAAHLDAMAPDAAWLRALYPALGGYIRWWLEHRRDAEGYLGYACSWESGQDLSPRFGDQPLGGGHPIRHIRPVDVHAALVQACVILAGFADRLGLPEEAARWRQGSEAVSRRLAELWDGTRWVDVDARSGRPTGQDDVMLAAPLALGAGRPDQTTQATRGTWLDACTDDGALVWPMFAWTGVEALRAAGRPEQAAEAVTRIMDRAYGRWDAPVADPATALPGVSAEYWPIEGGGGGEGYGWGAFGVHLLLSVLVGIRVTRGGGLELRPCLPPTWRASGRAFGLELTIRGRRRSIALRPRGPADLDVDLDGRTHRLRWGDALELAAGAGES